ncbi:unnamed protein product [Choristocarpus tenellus]
MPDEGMPDDECVSEGESLLVEHSDGRTFFLDIGTNGSATIGRMNVNMKPVIGEKYGTVFELDRHHLIKVEGEGDLVPDFDDTVTLDQVVNDNRNFVDTNTAQKLKEEDIRKMKEGGMGGQAIIEALMENSDTWGNKTQYSQAKWLRRKQQKYRPRIRAMKVTGSSLCDAYFVKHRDKVCGLRSDTLALILSNANVFAGAQVLLLDSCMGVVTAAVLDRMGCRGRVMALYPGSHPSHDAVRRFAYSEEDLARCLLPVPTSHLGRLADPGGEESGEGWGKEEEGDGGKGDERTIEEILEEYGKFMDDHGVPAKNREKNFAKKLARMRRNKLRPPAHQVREWMREGSDCLIIASKYDPTTSLHAMLPFLIPSRPFVVYSEFIEPLIACMRSLQLTGAGIKLQLLDTWMREFQVLPGRTHPLNNMSSSGGYLLAGIRVLNKHDPQASNNVFSPNPLEEAKGRGRKRRKGGRDS